VSVAFTGNIKDRNKLAKLLGFENFYDYKVGFVAAMCYNKLGFFTATQSQLCLQKIASTGSLSVL
jgi:hypothetical protein